MGVRGTFRDLSHKPCFVGSQNSGCEHKEKQHVRRSMLARRVICRKIRPSCPPVPAPVLAPVPAPVLAPVLSLVQKVFSVVQKRQVSSEAQTKRK